MPKKLQTLWERANYAAMMENMDSSIGMVLDELKAQGLEDNTYVSFLQITAGARATPLSKAEKPKWEGGLPFQ